MRNRTIALGLLVVAMPLGLLGCGDDAKPENDGGPRPESGSAQSPAAAEGPRLGGSSAGVSVALPDGWKQVDPATDASPVVQTSFELTGERGDLLKTAVQEQKKQGTVWAIDTSVASGYAPHLTAGCESGGLTGSSLEQLKAKVRALNPSARIADVNVGGKPGFKAAYADKNVNVTKDVAEQRVPVSQDRYCFVEVEAQQGKLPGQAQRILGSMNLH